MFGKSRQTQVQKFKYVYPHWLWRGYLGKLLSAYKSPELNLLVEMSEDVCDKLGEKFVEISKKIECQYDFTDADSKQLIAYERRHDAYLYFLEITVKAARELYKKDSSLKAFKDLEQVKAWGMFICARANIHAEEFTWVKNFSTGDSPGLHGD